ncbi:MAG: HAMP domain-containing histidine kinase [Rhodothermales bacterium]|nr:HAMP domain-containing histidine kinase [Rhodothermales bacterium]
MSFRTRLTFALLVATLVPVIALALILRADMQDRLTTQYEQRIASLVDTIVATLDEKKGEVTRDLESVRVSIMSDNQFRTGLESGSTAARRYVIDYAERAIRLTGMSSLLILDQRNRILSSGHFRNEYDRIDSNLSELISGPEKEFLLVEIRGADSVFTTLASARELTLGDYQLTLIGGISIEGLISDLRRANSDVVISLSQTESANGLETSTDSQFTRLTRSIELPFISLERDAVSPAALQVDYPNSELLSMKRSVDKLIIVVGSIGLLLSLLIAGWLGSVMSAPIAALSSKTKLINLDNLNVNFHSSRSDEIGDLSRTLSVMTTRLRKSRREILDAERRATIGDIARQINHDIKNGLTPIRNIVQYFDETAKTEGGDVTPVFLERRDTLLSSIEYLRQLATNYAKLSTPADRNSIDLVDIVRRIVEDTAQAGHHAINFSASSKSIQISATELALRRIFENMIGNAVDASLTVESPINVIVDVVENVAVVRVEDHGTGVPNEDRSRIFDDFYTTKAEGTGLGLSIVRRLVMDLHGTVRLEESSGDGSTFVVTLPVAN